MAIGQILYFFSRCCPIYYNEKVVALNLTLQALVYIQECVSFWYPRGMWKNIRDLLTDDGAHLNALGLKQYARNIKSCLLSCRHKKLL